MRESMHNAFNMPIMHQGYLRAIKMPPTPDNAIVSNVLNP